MQRQTLGRKIFAALAVFCGFGLTMLQIYRHTFYETSNETTDSTVASVGKLMLSTKQNGYALPFEVVSMLLLAAMIGCIVIAIKEKTNKIDERNREGEMAQVSAEDELNHREP